MNVRKRRGFTLIELLVVITIIGMLAALLLPALSGARESARRAQCINNQKNLGTALINFEGRRGRYPGWREQIGSEASTNASDHMSVSWIFVLLPDMDRNDLYRAYSRGGDRFGFIPTETMDVLICPSDAQDSIGGAPTSYACNAGMPDRQITSSISANETGDIAANGLFHDLDPVFQRPTNGRKKLVQVSSSIVSSNDGTTSTIMVGERVEAGSWAPDFEQLGTSIPGENVVGMVWQNDRPQPDGGLPEEARINGILPAPGEKFDDVNFVRPSSFHPGGVVVTFADGHTRFISDGMDYLVYVLLMTPNGRQSWDVQKDQEPLPEFLTTVLDDQMIQ
jgi:prepilin-type N-terminal cleavage/methylation domain-containing protein/prepilin-type processing-associated H-X9-DG protein